MQNLVSKISLLDASQLDNAEARLSILGTKMDGIAEKVNNQSDPERDAKVGEI